MEVVTQFVPNSVTYTTVVTLYDFTSISIPAGGFASDFTLTAERYDSNPAPTPSGFSILGTTYVFDAGGATMLQPVTLFFLYDPTWVRPGEIPALLYYDGATWIEVPCVVDTVNYTITATVSHFSVWAVASKSSHGRGAGLNYLGRSAVIAPAPVRSGQTICLYFDSPPQATHWQIFNLAGERVADLQFKGDLPQCWDARVAPGVYIGRVEASYPGQANKITMQKLAILR